MATTKKYPTPPKPPTYLLQVNLDLWNTLIERMFDGHIHYKWNAKMKSFSQSASEITQLDCSGFVRYILGRVSGKDFGDGSVNQRNFCLKQGFKKTTYDMCALKDHRLRIAFLDPEKNGPGTGDDEAGHTWLILDGITYESHGGAGCHNRSWATEVLRRKQDYCFVLTDPLWGDEPK